MKKVYLMTPGPTPVPDDVRLAEAKPIIHHRTPEFVEIYERVSEDLKLVFKTRNVVLTFLSSGTGAMEGAVANTLSPGDRALCITGGKFGERWSEICRAYGIEVVSLNVDWGDYARPEQVRQLLGQYPDIKAVFTALCETSTGTLFPIKEYGEIVRRRENTLLIVDAVSGLGACDLRTDEWAVDICVSGSQKGIMLPPGLAFASVSDKAWKFTETSTCPKYYFDFKKANKALEKRSPTAYTPGVSLVVALDKALSMLKGEGIDNVLERHAKLARATREGVKALGLTLFSKNPANAVTAIDIPPGIDGSALKNTLDKKYGVKVAGGQAHLKGKIIRIAHLGYMGQFDVITALSALELSLKDLGYGVILGKGVARAMEILK
ncbi:aminotransferase [candidate division WOR-3 bacterium JGI_Cruoil_03_44_89]|uniref:Aminotransferase n=1 Tax=candidate division WOR-3 bacterium JGI_Cruoil_03_44_89 TaxID=1973748 RepID=A0A235BXB7_UNCW3|nr:MAG: aminotransferase [candidate division WOR-3 bacterium JGI_Cruoil_03_44_89]